MNGLAKFIFLLVVGFVCCKECLSFFLLLRVLVLGFVTY